MSIAEINRETVLAFIKGDTDSFARIYRQLYPAIFLFAGKLLNDPELAKDIASETLMKVWHRRQQMENMEHIKSFAYLAAKNACLNQLDTTQRRRHYHKELLYVQSEISEDYINYESINADIIAEIYTQIELLPGQARKVCRLMLLENRTTKEVAQLLHISQKTVRNYKARAVIQIRCELIKKKLIATALLYAVSQWLDKN